jgi:RNA polymerase sigma-70 factor (ECF subfamily)
MCAIRVHAQFAGERRVGIESELPLGSHIRYSVMAVTQLSCMGEASVAVDALNSDASNAAAPTPSDESLVSAVKAGDESAFEILFERHKRSVARVAGRFFRQREQVEEIIQESFTKAFLSLNDYRGERQASFGSWIARIAINSCYDELRRAQRRPESTISDLAEDEVRWLDTRLQPRTSTPNLEETAILRDLAFKLMERLTAEDRMVLTLMIAEDLPVARIAEIMGWSIPKVKVRAYRARKSLRRLLHRFM